MTAENFARTLTVTSSLERSWAILTDVGRLAGWVTIVHDVEELSRLNKYTAVLADRVGPFKLRADLDITVVVAEDGRRIELQASGRDRAVDTRLAVAATMTLGHVQAGGTSLDVAGRYEVTGKAASLGAGVIRKKAESIINDFFASAARELGST